MNASGARWPLILLAVMAALPAQGQIRLLNKSGGGPAATVPAPEPKGPLLRWKNGEFLPGELDSATPDRVLWKAPIFGEPVALRTSVLRSMEFPKAGLDSREPFAVTLRNGDLVHGALVAIDAESVKLRSECHGSLTLRRAEVAELRRVSGGRLIYSTPSPGTPWKVKDDRNSQARATNVVWEFGSGRAPVLRSWNRTNHLPLKLPDKVDIEFHVRSTVSPRFRLDLNSSAGASPAIESWDDTLVLVFGGRFAPLLDLKPEDRDVQLRLCWDRAGRRCLVFDAAGKQLAELIEKVGPSRGLSEPGVHLRNMGLNITLASLRVREWNGAAPPRLKPGRLRVELINGSAENAAALGADENSVRVKTGSGPGRTIRIEDVESIAFAPESGGDAKPPQNELSFADGGFISGKLAGIRDGIATVETFWSAQPVSAIIDGLQVIRFAIPEDGGSRRKSPWRKWTGWWLARHPCTAGRSDPTTACCAGFRQAECIPCRCAGTRRTSR